MKHETEAKIQALNSNAREGARRDQGYSQQRNHANPTGLRSNSSEGQGSGSRTAETDGCNASEIVMREFSIHGDTQVT